MSAEEWECCCGGPIREVVLPLDIAKLSDRRTIWVHTESGDTRCYPGSPLDALCTAEPIHEWSGRD